MRNKRINNKKNHIKIIRGVLLISLICIFSYCAFQIIDLEKNKEETSNIQKEVSQVIETNKLEDTENTVIVNEEKKDKEEEKKEESLFWQYVRKPLTDFNINEIKSINPDTVAWLNLNGTHINVPVVQAKDNNYYLRRDFKKNPSQVGWIFADYRNKLDLTDKNIIIYGHNVEDKSMFSTLENVLTSAWQNTNTNHILNMSTATHNTMWQVISVYKVDYTVDYIQTKFTDKEYLEFLKLIKDRSVYNFNASTNEKTKVITLSTCTNGVKDGRIVLHAKLIKYEPKR